MIARTVGSPSTGRGSSGADTAATAFPDDRFREYYGQDHAFRIYSLPVVFIGGGQRFQYGGYWFGLIDPWPEYWSSDWYDSDDVYVNYDRDGYYLYNRRYPSDRVAISFYLD
jgi:hypothetical protein